MNQGTNSVSYQCYNFVFLQNPFCQTAKFLERFCKKCSGKTIRSYSVEWTTYVKHGEIQGRYLVFLKLTALYFIMSIV